MTASQTRSLLRQPDWLRAETDGIAGWPAAEVATPEARNRAQCGDLRRNHIGSSSYVAHMPFGDWLGGDWLGALGGSAQGFSNCLPPGRRSLSPALR